MKALIRLHQFVAVVQLIVAMQRGIVVNVIAREKRLQILAGLASGLPQRRVADALQINRGTVAHYSLLFGEGAQRLHNHLVRNLNCEHVQVDEIWAYVAKKKKRVKPGDPESVGEHWIYVGLHTMSRLVVSFLVAKRNAENTQVFINDLRRRLVVMPEIASDGWQPYVDAIAVNFGAPNYARLKKNYTNRPWPPEGAPAEPLKEPFIKKEIIFGAPDLDAASTSYVERSNGTARAWNARLHRRTLAFSKDLPHHKAAVALVYTWYNFCHVVRTLKVTPAMAAGITDHLWDREEFLDAIESAPDVGPPEMQPLVHVTPSTPHRELPGGRGMLRIVRPSGPQSPMPEAPAEPAAEPGRSDDDPKEPA
jgi:IS1 family transposase